MENIELTKGEVNNANNKEEDSSKNTTIKSIILLLYVIVSVVGEFFYREPLFQQSLDFESSWQRNAWDFTKTFYSIITNLGGEYCLILYLIVIYFFFPLTKSFCFIVGVIVCNFIDNLMKLWFHDPRPFWEKDRELFSGFCDGGFGNPSGHSFTSTFTYLGVFKLLSQTQIVSKHTWLKMTLFVFCVLMIIGIVLSRVILGMHSLNQVFYGCSLGLAVYYLQFHILYMQNMKIESFTKLFTSMKNLIISTVIFFISFLVLLLSYLLIDYTAVTKDYSDDKSILFTKCHQYKEEKIYRKFENDGFFGGLTLFCLMGAYYGQYFLWYRIHSVYGDNRDELVNKWVYNREGVYTSFISILKVIGIIILCALPMSIYLITFPNNLTIIFIFKVSIPFFITLFLLYGPGLYLMISLGLCNMKIFLKGTEEETAKLV